MLGLMRRPRSIGKLGQLRKYSWLVRPRLRRRKSTIKKRKQSIPSRWRRLQS